MVLRAAQGPPGSGMGSRLMMAHVPTGLPATQRVFSNAHGSALHRTYAGVVKKPTGNAATPCQSRASLHTVLSPKHSVEEPAMRRGPLTENPQPHAMKVGGRVVIAGDVATVPPTGLDALRLTEESQRPPTPRETIALAKVAAPVAATSGVEMPATGHRASRPERWP